MSGCTHDLARQICNVAYAVDSRRYMRNYKGRQVRLEVWNKEVEDTAQGAPGRSMSSGTLCPSV